MHIPNGLLSECGSFMKELCMRKIAKLLNCANDLVIEVLHLISENIIKRVIDGTGIREASLIKDSQGSYLGAILRAR